MPEFDFSGDFVSELNVAENDILTIVSMPIAEEKESPNQKIYDVKKGAMVAKKYSVLNMTIEVNGKTKTYTPDNKTGLRFQQAWGKDFSTWVGKQFTAKHDKYLSFGNEKIRIVGYPLEAQKIN